MKRLLFLSFLLVALFSWTTWSPPPFSEPDVALADPPEPSGALSPSPLNYDFTAGEAVVAAPSNYGFEDGSTDWSVSGGSATFETSGGFNSPRYVSMSGDGSMNPKVTSLDFIVDSSAPIFSFYRKHAGGFTMYKVEIAADPYTSWNQIAFGIESSATGWLRNEINISGYASSSVKIRYSAYGGVGFDEGATRKIPNWTVTSGQPAFQANASIAATNQSSGDYSGGATVCVGGSVPARTTSAAVLPGSAGIRSDPFTIPGDATHLSFWIAGESSASATMYLYLESEGYATGHLLFNKTINGNSIYTSCDVADWAGENVKITVGGRLYDKHRK